jgi:hypothetical protein
MSPIKKLKGALRANKGYTPEGDGIKQGAKAHPKNFHVKVQEMSNVDRLSENSKNHRNAG